MEKQIEIQHGGESISARVYIQRATRDQPAYAEILTMSAVSPEDQASAEEAVLIEAHSLYL